MHTMTFGRSAVDIPRTGAVQFLDPTSRPPKRMFSIHPSQAYPNGAILKLPTNIIRNPEQIICILPWQIRLRTVPKVGNIPGSPGDEYKIGKRTERDDIPWGTSMMQSALVVTHITSAENVHYANLRVQRPKFHWYRVLSEWRRRHLTPLLCG